MLKKRLNGKKGFTLVEVIVVLVILAILAALLVPKLVGWIDEANKKAAVADGHLILAGAQTIATEQYAAGITVDATVQTKIVADIGRYVTDGDKSAKTVLPTTYKVTNNKVMGFSYVSGAYTIKYENGAGFTASKT